MHCTNIQFTVKSARQADDICAICAKYYHTAKVTSVGYIGSIYHSAPAIIRCTYEDWFHAQNAWKRLVTELCRKGYGDCIH